MGKGARGCRVAKHYYVSWSLPRDVSLVADCRNRCVENVLLERRRKETRMCLIRKARVLATNVKKCHTLFLRECDARFVSQNRSNLFPLC